MVAFASPSICIGILLALPVEAVTPPIAAGLFSAALGMNMASHSGYWANIIDLSPKRAGFVLGVSNTIGNIPGAENSFSFAFTLKIEHLPRQARDKHSKQDENRAFSAGIYGNLLTGWVLSSSGSWVMVFGIAIVHWCERKKFAVTFSSSQTAEFA